MKAIRIAAGRRVTPTTTITKMISLNGLRACVPDVTSDIQAWTSTAYYGETGFRLLRVCGESHSTSGRGRLGVSPARSLVDLP
jgi:hypothetical protein